MAKINCWEFMKCGREPGGMNSIELGICSASVEISTDGINEGKNGGRACWALSGTFCEGEVQGSFASKIGNCKRCDFYKLVQREQDNAFQFTREIRRALMLSQVARQLGDGYKDVLLLKRHRLQRPRSARRKAQNMSSLQIKPKV